MNSRLVKLLVLLAAALVVFPLNALAYRPKDLSEQCEQRCKKFKKPSDGHMVGFRYKHSDLGGGMVALTPEFSSKAVFLEANTCKTIETTRYWGVANNNRHHYYSARGKAGASNPQAMARKAKRKGGTNQGYFKVGKLCYGPFNLAKEQE